MPLAEELESLSVMLTEMSLLLLLWAQLDFPKRLRDVGHRSIETPVLRLLTTGQLLPSWLIMDPLLFAVMRAWQKLCPHSRIMVVFCWGYYLFF